MRLLENNGEYEFLQEEITSLAEDVMNIDDNLDDVLEIQKWICENSLSMCDIIRDEHEIIIWAYEKIEDLEFKNKISNICIVIMSIVIIAMWIFTCIIYNGIK